MAVNSRPGRAPSVAQHGVLVEKQVVDLSPAAQEAADGAAADSQYVW